MEVYFREAYPRPLEGHFGRCYLDDDRITKDGLAQRIKAFRSVLRDHGIDAKVPFNLPHRVAAARAGMGTFGKNGLFYASRVARCSSWVLPIAVVVDQAFAPDAPTVKMGCPDWLVPQHLHRRLPDAGLERQRHHRPAALHLLSVLFR
jgi:epoxyqueuosine reductase